MKKIIAAIAAATLAAGVVFADGITFGSWGRGLFIGAANAAEKNFDADATDKPENTIVTGAHQSWGKATPRTALSVHGSTENVGFNLDMFANGSNGISVGDNANIWVKPIEQLKFTLGKIDQNELRGDACFGLWNWDRIGAVGSGDEEGWTFPDIFDAEGFSAIVYPIEGLSIGFALPININDDDTAPKTLKDAYIGGAKYGAGYTIDGVGTIKAGLVTKQVCNDKLEKKYAADLAAAFDLTAVDGLFVSVGANIPFSDYYYPKFTDNVITGIDSKSYPTVNAYGRFGIDPFTIHALVGTKLNTYDDKDDDPQKDGQFGFRFGAGVDIALDNNIGLFADVQYANGIWMANDSSDNNDTFTFGVGVAKSFSNGSIGIAFEGTTNAKGRYELENADDFAWEVPVKFEYWF